MHYISLHYREMIISAVTIDVFQESNDNVFGLSEEELAVREVIDVDIAEDMFPKDRNTDDPGSFQSTVRCTDLYSTTLHSPPLHYSAAVFICS